MDAPLEELEDDFIDLALKGDKCIVSNKMEIGTVINKNEKK